MLIPVRCFTCNKVLGHLGNDYERMTQVEGKTINEACKELKVKRLCCKKIMMTYTNMVDDLLDHGDMPFSSIKIK